jgi:UDP-glucose 4-epimerase
MVDPSTLHILGDGSQSKSYVHVDDVVSALRFVAARGMNGFGYFNVATEDYITVKEIADLICSRLGIEKPQYTFGGGTRGWKGDVPYVRFDTTKLRSLGWRNQRTAVEALRDSIDSMIADAKEGKLYRDN